MIKITLDLISIKNVCGFYKIGGFMSNKKETDQKNELKFLTTSSNVRVRVSKNNPDKILFFINSDDQEQTLCFSFSKKYFEKIINSNSKAS